MLVRGPEGLMSRPRAADDFATIRTRMEELRRQRLPEQPTPTTDTGVVGHRGPCALGRSLSPTSAADRARRFEGHGLPSNAIRPIASSASRRGYSGSDFVAAYDAWP